MNKNQLAKKYSKLFDIPKDDVMRMIDSGLKRGLSLNAIEIGFKMQLPNQIYTLKDVMAVTGESEEEILKRIESIPNPEQHGIYQIRQDILH